MKCVTMIIFCDNQRYATNAINLTCIEPVNMNSSWRWPVGGCSEFYAVWEYTFSQTYFLSFSYIRERTQPSRSRACKTTQTIASACTCVGGVRTTRRSFVDPSAHPRSSHCGVQSSRCLESPAPPRPWSPAACSPRTNASRPS